MNKFIIILGLLAFSIFANASDQGVPLQLKFKNPSGTYPNATGVLFSVQVLSPSFGCVLYEEDFSNQTVVNGSISLALGAGLGSAAGFNPNLPLNINAAFDNSTVKSNLTCVDSDNVVQNTNQTYTPSPGDTRVLRIRTTISGDNLVVDFIQRAVPYALHAETVGGKVASDIIVQNASTSLNQSNLESIFANPTKFNKLQNLATNGVVDNAVTATSAGSANYFTTALIGDVTGTQSATTVAGLRGVPVAATAPVAGQFLGFNGTEYLPMSVTASAPVSSVNGKTGSVVLTSADIQGSITSASALSGDVTGTLSSTVVSTVGGKAAASIAATVNDVFAATSLASTNTLVKRDGSGGLTAAVLYSGDLRVNQGVKFYNVSNTNRVSITAPATFTDYDLILPSTDGNAGEVLQTNGSGVLTWAAGTTVTSAAVITALGYTPADNSLVVVKSNNLSDLTSATLARTNLGLGQAAVLNLGTTSGTVASGDDSRIVNALSQTSFNSYVSNAGCSSTQSLYWNSVSSQFLCSNISISGDVTGSASAVTVTQIRGVGVSFSSLASNHILQYNGSNIVNRAIPTCTSGEYLTFNGSVWSCVADAGFSGSITSLAVTAPLSSTGGSTPTLSITQASSSNSGFLSNTDWNTFNNKITSSTAAIVAVLGYVPASSTGTIAASRLPAFSGDVSSSAGSSTLTLSNSGVSAGSYYKVTVDTKGRVTSGNALTASDITTALGYTPANNSSSGTFLVKSNNLSDLTSATAARTSLGLGSAATLNVGTTSGTVAAGDDPRLTGTMLQSTFNAYVSNAGCSSTQSLYWNSVSSQFLCTNISISGDVSGSASSVTVTKIQGVGASFSAIANGHILQHNGTQLVNRLIPTCSANQYLTFNGTSWACVTDSGSSGVVSSVAVLPPLQSTGGMSPTISMAQATGAVSGYLSGTDWTTFNNKLTSSTVAISQALGFSPANSATVLAKSLNLSDLTNVATARLNLGLGGFATASSLDLGSASATGTLSDARMPALTGDVTSSIGSVATTVEKIRGVNVDPTIPTVGQLMVFNGSSWAPVDNPVTTTRKAADQAIATTALTNVSSLAFNVTAGVTYKFHFLVLFTSGATGTGAKFTVTVPAGALSAQANIPTAIDGIDSVWFGAITASGDAVTSTATPATGTTYFGKIEGIFVCTTSGVLQVQVGSETGTAITVKAGSSGELTVIP